MPRYLRQFVGVIFAELPVEVPAFDAGYAGFPSPTLSIAAIAVSLSVQFDSG